MSQLSRPYQIGLAAIALLAAAWLLFFQGHHSSSASGSSASAPAAATRTVTAAKTPSHGTAGQATGGGSASSLGAYGHAIEKARGAVATSQKNAKELEHRSAQASSPNASSSPSASSKAAGAAATASAAKTADPSTSAKTTSTATHKSSASAQSRQSTVEAQLKSGRIALILFWNPRGSDDKAVHHALARLPHSLRFSVDDARPGEVASFGSITRGVQVYGTPTLLVVNKKGNVTTLTGLQDSFAIAQAIREARHS